MKLVIPAVVASLALHAPPAAGQWVEAPGAGWIDLTLYHQDTRSAFQFDGEERDFFADGHAISSAVFVTVATGLLPGVDVWVQVPFQRLRFDDARSDRVRQGIGDTRTYLRVAPLRLLGSGFPLAVRAGVKVPVGDFAVDSEVIPLGDGQTDWEVMAEMGHSFYPVDAYANGWVGYRWRAADDETRRDFGDEVFFLGQVGGRRGAIGLQLILEAMESVTTPRSEGVLLPNAGRGLVQLTPRATLSVGEGQVSTRCPPVAHWKEPPGRAVPRDRLLPGLGWLSRREGVAARCGVTPRLRVPMLHAARHACRAPAEHVVRHGFSAGAVLASPGLEP